MGYLDNYETVPYLEYFLPTLFKTRLSWYLMLFYSIVNILPRIIVNKYYPKSKENDPDYHFKFKRNEALRRYPVSFFHATFCVILYFLRNAGYVEDITVFFNSAAYFLTDIFIDADFEYTIHHLFPIFYGEILIGLDAKLYNSASLLCVLEMGNFFTNTATLITYRIGVFFHYLNIVCFYISRPFSMYFSYKALFYDVEPEKLNSWLGYLMVMFISLTYIQNLNWMIKMVMPKQQDKNSPMKSKDKKEKKHN